MFKYGDTAWLDGEVHVRVLDVYEKGSTSLRFPHARVEYVEDDAVGWLTLIDRTGRATERGRCPRQTVCVNLSRLTGCGSLGLKPLAKCGPKNSSQD